jgi:membrane protease YdiL (CAAX protease family)
VKTFLRSLSLPWEFAFVVLCAFGLTMLGNVLLFFRSAPAQAAEASRPPISTSSLWGLLVEEFLVLLVLVTFLGVRGWSRDRVGFNPTVRQTFAGLALAVSGYVAYVLSYWLVAPFGPAAMTTAVRTPLVANDLDLTVIIATSLINPVFEELFLCGYVITVLKGYRGGWLGLHVSIAIRVLCHLYQGPLGVISIVPAGLIFGIYYLRTGRLWPIILAHALWDFIGLSRF